MKVQKTAPLREHHALVNVSHVSRCRASRARAIFQLWLHAKGKKKIISVSRVEELLSSMQRSYLADHYFRELLQAETFTEAGRTR